MRDASKDVYQPGPHRKHDRSMSSTPEFAAAAVAAPHIAAAQAGQTVLAQGGNALEAMVAMAAVIAVVHPHASGLGGDGVWVVRAPGGKVRCLEACGAAGERATARSYWGLGHETSIPPRGPLATLAAPGAAAGWAQALELSRALGGRLPLADLLREAIRLAREGAPTSPCEARLAPALFDDLARAPGFAATFLTNGERFTAGAPRRQEKLADTLAHLAHAGVMDFYRGDVARELAADLARMGAPVTRADLKRQEARWVAPLSVQLRGATLWNAPPPTQGLAALMIPGLMERLESARPDAFEHAHGLIEAAKRAFAVDAREGADLAWSPGDPARWLEPSALEREAAQISMNRSARRAAPCPTATTRGAGVWMGAIDPSGLAVSCAQSLHWDWGSGCVSSATGVLLGNAGAAFSLNEESVHALRPGRRPRCALNAPVAAFDDGRIMVYGAAGGDGAALLQAQVLARLRAGAPPDAAVDAPRIQLGRTLHVETGFDPTLLRALARAGHDVEEINAARADMFGHAGALTRARDGRIQGAHDARADGGALGL